MVGRRSGTSSSASRCVRARRRASTLRRLRHGGALLVGAVMRLGRAPPRRRGLDVRSAAASTSSSCSALGTGRASSAAAVGCPRRCPVPARLSAAARSACRRRDRPRAETTAMTRGSRQQPGDARSNAPPAPTGRPAAFGGTTRAQMRPRPLTASRSSSSSATRRRSGRARSRRSPGPGRSPTRRPRR